MIIDNLAVVPAARSSVTAPASAASASAAATENKTSLPTTTRPPLLPPPGPSDTFATIPTFGLVWSGLVWSGLVWSGLAWMEGHAYLPALHSVPFLPFFSPASNPIAPQFCDRNQSYLSLPILLLPKKKTHRRIPSSEPELARVGGPRHLQHDPNGLAWPGPPGSKRNVDTPSTQTRENNAIPQSTEQWHALAQGLADTNHHQCHGQNKSSSILVRAEPQAKDVVSISICTSPPKTGGVMKREKNSVFVNPIRATQPPSYTPFFVCLANATHAPTPIWYIPASILYCPWRPQVRSCISLRRCASLAVVRVSQQTQKRLTSSKTYHCPR